MPLMHLLTLCWFNTGMLFFLASKGLALNCEICHGSRLSCTGTKETCTKEFDMCATIQADTISRQEKIAKMCMQSSNCYENHLVLNVGRGETLLTKLSCCSGQNCTKPATYLPPVSLKLNGKRCKACFSYRHPYIACWRRRITSCAGDQNYCLEISGWGVYPYPGTTPDLGRRVKSTRLTVKGCVNQAYCESFHMGSVYVGTFTVIGQGSCKLASATATPVPGLFGPSLLTGFLLVKILA